ncbi:MAG: carbon storage regulator [Planctomycetaceae bacterium]|nr:carbon storage regulator [Planctomycetaceae bacterium]MBQ2820922.1 carbon storage regulator [Thermoguttaceae bacterium]MDO4424573.1 carbon storage regulator [Planctomycetia bacterium]
MLVLSRKESERIRVGDSIVVTVVRLTKDRVRLGIEAPDDVLVLRDELEKESEPLPALSTVSEIKAKPMPKSGPGLSPLARKMKALPGRRVMANCAVALEEDPVEDISRAKTRRCPERTYFRCD